MRKFVPAIFTIVFALAVMFPAMGGGMRAHAHESTGAAYVQDRDAFFHSQERDVPFYIGSLKQDGESAGNAGDCPDGHTAVQACCEVFCQVANMPSDFVRMDAKLDNNRLMAIAVAPAVKQRPTLIERPPKSIGPIFG